MGAPRQGLLLQHEHCNFNFLEQTIHRIKLNREDAELSFSRELLLPGGGVQVLLTWTGSKKGTL